MNKRAAAVVLFFIPIIFAFSAERGTIVEMNGKVEVKRPGGGWEAAKTGADILEGSSISTGFGSWVKVVIANAEVRIEPLSRLTLAEAVRRQSEMKTDLRLRVGKVRVDIKKDPNLKVDFAVRTPVSTAAVRGSGFTISRKELEVHDGDIRFSNRLGRSRSYRAGQRGRIPPGRNPVAPGEVAEAAAREKPFTRTGIPPRTIREETVPTDVIGAKGTLVITW